MHHLPIPSIDVTQVYPSCAHRTRVADLRNNLVSEQPRVFQRSLAYAELAQRSRLYEITTEASIHVTSHELGNLYNRVLVNGGERAVYEQIRTSGRFGRCALCTQRDIKTLDHYIPKETYPEFSVLPINLVPSCFECNHAKGSHIPATFADQMFHPYFDNWDNLELLCASIVIDGHVFAEFRINWEVLPQEVGERARTHFRRLGLATLYSEHASIELVQRREYFTATFEQAGVEGLRDELQRESESRRRPFPNAWQPVLYRALSSSEEFVRGGFNAIDDSG